MGRSRQQTTASHVLAKFASYLLLSSSLRICVRSDPSIKRALGVPSPSRLFAWTTISLNLFSTTTCILPYIAVFSGDFSTPSGTGGKSSGNLNLRTWKVGWISLQLLAIFSAVSILSPVNIQTLISILIDIYLPGLSLWLFLEHRPAAYQELQSLRWYTDRSKAHRLAFPSLFIFKLEESHLLSIGKWNTTVQK